jgi:hypothetical protein
MANHDKFIDIADAIHAGIENLNKWYRKTDDTDAYFICLGMFRLFINDLPLSSFDFSS